MAKLAELSGYTESYIGQIERGVKVPTFEAIEAMANVLGMDVGSLIVGFDQDRFASLIHLDYNIDAQHGMFPVGAARIGVLADDSGEGTFAQVSYPALVRQGTRGFAVGVLLDIMFRYEVRETRFERYDIIIFDEQLKPENGEIVLTQWSGVKDDEPIYIPELRLYRVVDGEPMTWPPTTPIPYLERLERPPFYDQPRPLGRSENIMGVALEVRRPLRTRERMQAGGVREADVIMKKGNWPKYSGPR